MTTRNIYCTNTGQKIVYIDKLNRFGDTNIVQNNGSSTHL